jgi:hypothetical protein
MAKKPGNNQNLKAWRKWHLGMTKIFVNKVAPCFGISAKINLGKLEDRGTVDVLVESGGQDIPTELAVVNTPYYTAWKHGVNPDYAVSFNVRQLETLSAVEVPTLIIFWVEYPSSIAFGRRIEATRRVYWNWVSKFVAQVRKNKPPMHEYNERKEDPGENAESSYVLDIRNYAQELPEREAIVFSLLGGKG